MEPRLTPAVIALAVVIGTVVGPLSALGDVTTANLTDQTYWLDMLAATIRSFASVAVAGLGLIAGAYGLPALRGHGAPRPIGETLRALAELERPSGPP